MQFTVHEVEADASKMQADMAVMRATTDEALAAAQAAKAQLTAAQTDASKAQALAERHQEVRGAHASSPRPGTGHGTLIGEGPMRCVAIFFQAQAAHCLETLTYS